MHRLRSFFIILVLWTSGLCAAAQFAKMGLFLPELQQLYPEAGATSGFLITLISLVGALLGLVAGVAVGQLGPRTVLIAGLTSGCAISLFQSFNLPLSFLLISRVFEGASHLAIVVAAPTLIARHSDDRLRTMAMTLWGTFFAVSFMLTAWLGLPLVAAQGIHELFFSHAIALGLISLLVILTIPIEAASADSEPSDPKIVSLKNLLRQHNQAWTSPYIAAPAIGWLFYTLTFVALLAILPNLMPIDQRAFVAGSMPLASIVSSLTLGAVLLWRYTAIQIVNVGFIAAISFALLFLVIPGKANAGILLFAAMGLIQGASFAAVPQLIKSTSNQALAYGAMAQTGNIGNLCGTPLLLFLHNSGGIKTMITFVVACYIAAIVFHIALSRRRNPDNLTNKR